MFQSPVLAASGNFFSSFSRGSKNVPFARIWVLAT
jgi:hypothetical protein